MSSIQLKTLNKLFGETVAVDNLNLEIKEGEIFVLLGPSGCGKTTTLRMIAGFEEPSNGSILLDGKDYTKIPPEKRNIGMVFQDYALFPHLNVYANIGYGLKERKFKKKKIKDRVKELLKLIQLKEMSQRYPAELSGGQQQRVALARAIAFYPQVLLMDEPLGALDLKLRQAMQIELKKIQRELKITTVYVTHDQEEALTLADRIAVMNEGQLLQLDNSYNIYSKPNSKFVADFIGKMNFINCFCCENCGDTKKVKLKDKEDTIFSIITTENFNCGDNLSVAIRPELLKINKEKNDNFSSHNHLHGNIEKLRYIGNLVHYYVRISPDQFLIVEDSPDPNININEEVFVSWQNENVHIWKD